MNLHFFAVEEQIKIIHLWNFWAWNTIRLQRDGCKVGHKVPLVTIIGGSIAQWLSYLLLDPSATGLIPSVPVVFSEKIIVDVAEVNQRRCLEESQLWLENVGGTHLVSTG